MIIKLEKLSGENRKGKVGKIKVSVGETIQVEDLLMQIETKKGNTPIKSKVVGKVMNVLVEEGDDVAIGEGLLEVDASEVSQTQNTFSYFNKMLLGRKEQIEADLTIIGAGPGGYVAALYAAKKGLKTVLIEKEKMGGTCLNVGCIPTKTFVKSSEVFSELLKSEAFGISCQEPKVHMEKVVERKNQIKERLSKGIEVLLEQNDVKVVRGIGKFVDIATVEVKQGLDEITVQSKHIIIATGSKITTLPIPGIDKPFVLNSTTALDYEKLPKSITIIGGGVIGMEFAFMYANFGVEVTVVEYMNHVLGMVSTSISEEITQQAGAKGIQIYTGSKVIKIEETTHHEAIVVFEHEGQRGYSVSEKVLVAVGREPNIEELGLEKAHIKLNTKGKGIAVDEYLRTNVDSIYAIGDVNNKLQLAHVASHQGMIAVDHILGGEKRFEETAIPNVIFTSPEIATVGLTLEAAKEKGIQIKVSRFPFAANGKALTMGAEEGFIEIIKDVKANQIIGASLIGADASVLISALTLILKYHMSEEQVIDTVFAHPTTAEVIHEAILGLGIGALHFYE